MAAYDEQDFPLTGPLDLNKLRDGFEQEFELDTDQIDEYGFEDDGEQQGPHGFTCYEKDFCTEDDESKDKTLDGDVMEFDKLAQKMANVTSDGGVKKQVVVQGYGEIVPLESFVKIHYNAYFECQDEPFDSTYMRQRPLGFCLGNGTVLPGIDIAVCTMRKGEKSRFLIGPSYALGPLGCEPRVPKNATGLYVIELISFSEAGSVESLLHGRSKQELRELPFDTIQKVVKFRRKEAKEMFRVNNYKQAGRLYQQAINLLNDYHLQNEEEEVQQQKTLKELYLNLAVVNVKLNRFKPTIKCCNDVLRIDGTESKAFFLKAKALRKLGCFDDAKSALDRASKLRKSCTEITEEYRLLNEQKKQFDNLEKTMCQRMFGTNNTEKSSSADKHSVLGKVSREFQETILNKLNVFKSDPETTELPVATSPNLSLTDLRAMGELARSIGLYTTSERTQNGLTSFRICKNDPG